MPRRRIRALTLTAIGLAGALLLGGCLSKAITNREAGDIIRASTAFTRPKFAHIPRLVTIKGYSYRRDGVLSINGLAQYDPTVAILKLQRVVSVNESVYGSGSETVRQIVVWPVGIDSAALSADEEAAADGTDRQASIDAQEERRQNYSQRDYYTSFKKEVGWRVPIGTRQFIDVQKIHNWRDANENIPVNELEVEFTWRWVPNDFGSAFDTQNESFVNYPDTVQRAAESWGVRMNTESAMLSRAFFRREGNQWRLGTIQWSFGRGNPR
jgi:hypothetical protein